MARIRSIHPGLWTDEAFVSVSRDARLLFIGLLNECDDQGAFELKPLQIKMRLCPGDDTPVGLISSWLSELEGANLIRSYSIGAAQFGAVRNFCQWQRPKKPNSVFPMPDEFRTYAGIKTGSSEPDDVEGEGVPNLFGTGGTSRAPSREKSPQRKEEGGRREKEREPPVSPPIAKRAKARIPVPPDWRPDEAGSDYARARGVPVVELAKFRNHHASKGSLFADIPAAWRTWCDKAVEFGRASGRPIEETKTHMPGSL